MQNIEKQAFAIFLASNHQYPLCVYFYFEQDAIPIKEAFLTKLSDSEVEK